MACELPHFLVLLEQRSILYQTGEVVLLPDEDEEISRKFTEIFSKKYNVYLGYETTYVSKETSKDKNIASNNGNDNNYYNKFHVIAKNASGKQIDLESDAASYWGRKNSKFR